MPSTLTQSSPGPGPGHTPATVRTPVVVVHNHWIHYKDLLFRELCKRIDDFHVILTSRESNMRLATPELAALPYSCEALSALPYEHADKLRCAGRVFARLCALRPSIVIVSGWYDAVSWAAWTWAQVSHKPSVLWAESNEFDRPRTWWRELPKRWYVGGFAQAHVYGTTNVQYLVNLGMDSKRVLTKRAVLDVDHFHRIGSSHFRRATRSVLFVGRLAPEKNLHRLIRTFASVQQQTPEATELRIVGYGPLHAELAQLASALGVASSVKFLGPVPQGSMPEVYSDADLFILPSVSETWGLVANEALCCELPILISNRCGCAADLVTAETGWVFDPFDEAAIAHAITKALAMPPEALRAMGKAGRTLGVTYSPSLCADRVVDGLRGLR